MLPKQVHELARTVAARPPAAGSPEEAEFFGHPRHMAARMIRDILTGDEATVRERILDIMPHIVQVRAPRTACAKLVCSVQVAWPCCRRVHVRSVGAGLPVLGVQHRDGLLHDAAHRASCMVLHISTAGSSCLRLLPQSVYASKPLPDQEGAATGCCALQCALL